jgi:hypothetical protein
MSSDLARWDHTWIIFLYVNPQLILLLNLLDRLSSRVGTR